MTAQVLPASAVVQAGDRRFTFHLVSDPIPPVFFVPDALSPSRVGAAVRGFPTAPADGGCREGV